MASIVKYWIKQFAETKEDVYDKLTRNYWQNFGMTVVMQIERLPSEEADVESLVREQTVMFTSLKVQNDRKKSIRFEGDLDKDVSEPIVEYSKLTLDVYEHSMKDLLYKTCCAYFEHAEKKKCRAIFPSLVDFLMKFGSEDMFVSVARSYKLGSGFALYDGILRGWLASDSMRSRALAQLIFIMSKTFSDRELELLFHSFQQMSPVAVEWCISLSLSPEMLVRPAASKWLRSALVKQTLLSLCRRGDEAGSRLVLDCLASYEGDLCVGEQTAQSIVSTLTDTVSPERCKLAADVCRALASTDFAETSLPLAMRIFDLALEHLSKDKDTYTEEEVEDQAEVETLRASVWQAVLDAWSSVAGPALCEVAIPAIYKHLLEDEDTLDTQLIERLVSLCPFLTDYDDIEDLIDQIFNIPIESSDTAVRTFALRQDCVYGRLSCPLETVETKRLIEIAEDNTLRDLERRDVVLFTRCLVLRAGFFKEVIADGRENDARLTNPISFDHVLMRLLEDTAIISSLCDGYAFANFYDILKQCKVYMDAKINDIIDTYDNDGEYLRHMLSLLLNKSTDVGFYWIQAYKLLKNRAHKALDLNLDTELMATVDVAMCSASNIKNWSQLEFSTRIDMLNEIVTQNGYYHILEGYKNKTQDADLKSSYFPMVRSWCVAHDLTSNAEENVGRREQFADKVHEALSTLSLVPIMDDYYKYGEKMFNDRDYTKESWRMTCCQSTLLDCLGAMVDSRGWDMDSHEWDFVNIVLCSVLTSLTLTPQLGCTKLAMITRPALKLFRSVITFVNNVREECVKREPRAHIAELPTEWRDIFAPTAFTDIVALLSHVLRSAEDTTMTVCYVATIDELIGAVRLINWDLTSAEKKQKEHSLDTLASLAIHVLSQDVPSAYKYLAFAAVRMLSKPLVLDDVEKLSQAGERSEREGDEDETIISLSLARYYDALRIQLVQLDGLLQEDSKIEDESVDKSALCSASLSFLLTALAALMQSELARGDLVHHYINSFGESELISCIVLVSMRLLPADVLRAASNDSPTAALSDNTLDHFTGDPKLSVHDADIMSIVHATSCRVLYSTMRAASGSVRSYWSSMSARRAATLRRIVIHAIAQPLIDEQLQHLRYHNSILEDAEVYIWRSQGGKHSRGECVVRCVATAEERALELAISLSEAHPLDPPRPVPVAAAPVPTHRLHFIRVYLAYQNGWVINALKMWTEMVRSRVESAAQCYICYCRLHPTTGKLPNVPCYTCNNRFHSHCLRKWFKTSKKSNCPLCRTVF
ncbi:unnamed protein product [Leptosia nina]|uniref:E3 ubiquitin-protein ligase listerin n=1 Tax=Leptosia nina TaxID=320188 RepID=A0AAV1IZY3_9NEOP